MTDTNFMASLTIVTQFPGLIFYFAHYDSEFGNVPTEIQMMQEPLRTPLVDGVRYLDDHREPRIFRAITFEDVADYQAAKVKAAEYQRCRNSYADLWTSNDSETRRVKILTIGAPQASNEGSPKALAGSLAGVGTTPGFTGIVAAIWTFHSKYPQSM